MRSEPDKWIHRPAPAFYLPNLLNQSLQNDNACRFSSKRPVLIYRVPVRPNLGPEPKSRLSRHPQDIRCFTLFATHFHELASLEHTTSAVRNRTGRALAFVSLDDLCVAVSVLRHKTNHDTNHMGTRNSSLILNPKPIGKVKRHHAGSCLEQLDMSFKLIPLELYYRKIYPKTLF